MEVVLYKRLITIVLFFSFSALASIPPNAHFGITQKNDDLTVNFTREEIKFAKSLEDLLRQLSRLKLNDYTIKVLKNNDQSTVAFKEYRPMIDRIVKISKSKKNIKKFVKACKLGPFTIKQSTKSKQLKHSNKILNIYNKKIDYFCRQYILKSVLKIKTSKLRRKDLKAVAHALPFYLQGKPSRYLTRLLKRTKRYNKNIHNHLSAIITENYIKFNLYPRKKITSRLRVTQEFTDYVESRVGRPEEIEYYYSEFKVLKKLYRKAARANNSDLASTYIKQLLSFHEQNSKYIPRSAALKTFEIAGKFFLYKELYQNSLELLQYCKQISITSKELNKSLYNLIHANMVRKDYQKSLAIIEQNNLIEKFADLPTKLQFWIAYTMQQSDERYLAKYFFSTLVHASPINYYSIIALQQLSQMSYDKTNKIFLNSLKANNSIAKININAFAPVYLNSLKRVAIWAKLKNERFADLEIKTLFNKNFKSLFKNTKIVKKLEKSEIQQVLTVNVIKLLAQLDQHLQNFKIIQKSLGKDLLKTSRKLINHLFPFKYFGQIKEFGKKLDPLIILSLIRQESAFNPKARSRVGARGLMQIMPTTAKGLDRKVKKRDLMESTTNLHLGIKYFKMLLKKFDGNLIFSLAAYNAGENRVKRWQQERFTTDDPLLLIESIPFRETRQYVKLIYRNYFFYKYLQNKNDIRKSIKDSFVIKTF